ncbi:MAG: GNAT family N-acetyltransferase [Bacteroidetes bacterium]|nr:GNAT family N-acetyltransferase [Bacteroidota bacterium]
MGENAGEVEKLYVHRKFQSQSAGTLLLQIAEAFALEKVLKYCGFQFGSQT